MAVPDPGGSAAVKPAQILTVFVHPVSDEQQLTITRDRTFPASHDVDPWRIMRLDPEFGIGGILASAPGNPIIDDHQLAMIANVDPAADHAHHDISDWQRDAKVDPSAAEVIPMGRADESPRAESIGEHADLDPAPGGTDEGVLEFQPVIVVEPDVEAGVDCFAKPIDVGDHLVDRDIAVRGKVRRLPAVGPSRLTVGPARRPLRRPCPTVCE